MTAVFINKQGPVDHTYIGHLHGKAIVVYARTPHQAKQRAVEYFKPKKKDMGLLSIQLHSINTEPINVIEEVETRQ